MSTVQRLMTTRNLMKPPAKKNKSYHLSSFSLFSLSLCVCVCRSVTGSDGARDVGAQCLQGDGSDAFIAECKAITRLDCSRPHNCCFPQAKGGKYSDSVSCSDLICQSLIVCNSACLTNADLNVEIIPLTVLPKLWSLHMKICSHIWKAS